MKGILVQFGCTFIFTLIQAMTAFSCAWPSKALRILKSEYSPLGFKITQNDGNIISSIPMLGSFISTLFAGYVAEAIGRKKTMILCGLLNTVSWSLIVTARSTLQIILGRFIIGLSSGVGSVTSLVYITEVTQLSTRGSAISVASLFYNVGVLMSYLYGWLFSYDVVCYIGLTAAVVFVILMSCLKETPAYLLKIGREKEALNSLKFYRGESRATDTILGELSYLKSLENRTIQSNTDVDKPLQHSEKDKLHNRSVNENTENKNPWILLFTIPHNRRAITTLGTFVVLTVSMGMVAVQTYANQLFATAVPSLSPDLCSVLFALVLVASSILTMVVTDLVPRRTLMISTCTIATICLATLGFVMRCRGAPMWLALVAILLYCVVFQLGVINIVFVQLAESFGPQVNSAAAATILCLMYATNFAVLLLFAPAVDYVGIDGAFFVFTTIGAITTVLSVLCLKETRRLPLEGVQGMYDKGFFYNTVRNIARDVPEHALDKW